MIPSISWNRSTGKNPPIPIIKRIISVRLCPSKRRETMRKAGLFTAIPTLPRKSSPFPQAAAPSSKTAPAMDVSLSRAMGRWGASLRGSHHASVRGEERRRIFHRGTGGTGRRMREKPEPLRAAGSSQAFWPQRRRAGGAVSRIRFAGAARCLDSRFLTAVLFCERSFGVVSLYFPMRKRGETLCFYVK